MTKKQVTYLHILVSLIVPLGAILIASISLKLLVGIVLWTIGNYLNQYLREK